MTTTSAGDLETAELAGEHASAVELVAGRSPTQIAFERLRKDKVAVVCFTIVMLLVLLAILAPVITNAMNIYWDIQDPNRRIPAKSSTSTVTR